MLMNHYEAERVMAERVKDALREAEQARLIQMVTGSRESQGGRLVAAILRWLQATVVPVFVPGPRRTDTLCRSAFSKTVCSMPCSHSTEC
jgi:hypothetical protein